MKNNEELVSICCKGVKGRVDPRTIKRRAIHILKAAGHPSAELSLLLCDDMFIQKLNLDYRGLDAPTDVLSFSMKDGPAKGNDSELLGDVVVSVETAAKQATAAGKKLTDEITSLVVHGILHLLGYSHGNKKNEKAMFEEAMRIEKIVLLRT